MTQVGFANFSLTSTLYSSSSNTDIKICGARVRHASPSFCRSSRYRRRPCAFVQQILVYSGVAQTLRSIFRSTLSSWVFLSDDRKVWRRKLGTLLRAFLSKGNWSIWNAQTYPWGRQTGNKSPWRNKFLNERLRVASNLNSIGEASKVKEEKKRRFPILSTVTPQLVMKDTTCLLKTCSVKIEKACIYIVSVERVGCGPLYNLHILPRVSCPLWRKGFNTKTQRKSIRKESDLEW